MNAMPLISEYDVVLECLDAIHEEMCIVKRSPDELVVLPFVYIQFGTANHACTYIVLVYVYSVSVYILCECVYLV